MVANLSYPVILMKNQTGRAKSVRGAIQTVVVSLILFAAFMDITYGEEASSQHSFQP